MFGGGHKASKLKIDLRLSINRLKLAQKKKSKLPLSWVIITLSMVSGYFGTEVA